MLGYSTRDNLQTETVTKSDEKDGQGEGKWWHYLLPGHRSTNGVVWQGMPIWKWWATTNPRKGCPMGLDIFRTILCGVSINSAKNSRFNSLCF